MRYWHITVFITDKLHLSTNSATLTNISAVIYSHIQKTPTHKVMKYNAITIPLCSVGNIYNNKLYWKYFKIIICFVYIQDALMERIFKLLYNLLQYLQDLSM